MINIKSPREIAIMREAGRLVAQCHAEVIQPLIKPGVSYLQIDHAVDEFIRGKGCIPSFKNYRGFPASTCIVANDVVVHGIPDGRKLKEGDILSVDLGVFYNGYHGDSVWTYAVGEVSPLKKKLMEANEKALWAGIEQCVPGNTLGDVGYAMNAVAESYGFKVNRQYGGHGVGRQMHEDPSVPNYGDKHRGVKLRAGMTLAIEPILHTGSIETKVLADNWTVISVDGSISAQYEHSIAVTNNEPIVLTVL